MCFELCGLEEGRSGEAAGWEVVKVGLLLLFSLFRLLFRNPLFSILHSFFSLPFILLFPPPFPSSPTHFFPSISFLIVFSSLLPPFSASFPLFLSRSLPLHFYPISSLYPVIHPLLSSLPTLPSLFILLSSPDLISSYLTFSLYPSFLLRSLLFNHAIIPVSPLFHLLSLSDLPSFLPSPLLPLPLYLFLISSLLPPRLPTYSIVCYLLWVAAATQPQAIFTATASP